MTTTELLDLLRSGCRVKVDLHAAARIKEEAPRAGLALKEIRHDGWVWLQAAEKPQGKAVTQ